jgi:DnaJ-class molecular chaperone
MREILEKIERRKEAKDDPCDSCDGTGSSSNDSRSQPLACGHCLGQGILLTAIEYQALMNVAGVTILDAEIIEPR